MLRHVHFVKLLLVVASIAPISTVASNPWTEITERDLETIAEAIRVSHPGPVDTLNPRFGTFLEAGLADARERAQNVENFQDYKRVLMRFANGFRDGHLRLSWPVDVAYYRWPGFLPQLGPDGAVRVGLSETASAEEGEVIHSCDGRPLTAHFDENVAPYYVNVDIPQKRNYYFSYALLADSADAEFSQCSIGEGQARRQVDLQWRRIDRRQALDKRWAAVGLARGELGLHRHGDIWMLSIPTFNYWSSDSIDQYRALLDDVRVNADAIRQARAFVIDVRGNTGGVSVWGDRMAAALWDSDFVTAVREHTDASAYADWRVSETAFNHNRTLAERLAGDDAETAAQVAAIADGIAEAMRAGEEYYQQGEGGAGQPLPQGESPFSGDVYFLTDYVCASACLDFADLILRLPGVTHIGLSTSGDTVYIDNTAVVLPSGLASLSLSMKVWRDRLRGNNEFYTPAHVWPGGRMTDDALIEWVRELSADNQPGFANGG
ncbi:S41 family peptidase [Parasphingopyxis sp.]|uniref:S41 family peptidase n=1 Tax=Parasphingopyxis sp. TaxID=1920299 RepID=UPI0026398E55|nr:S41 family peptidase [Parasphingopyxis sp.]